MQSQQKNIAVILAGGSGKRFGLEIPKQFAKVAGKTVIEHTLDVFNTNLFIDEIAVIINHEYMEQINDLILQNNWKKVKKVLCGGNERYESSLAAINAYKDIKDVNLIFHDAVRPLVSSQIITDVVNSLKTYEAADVAIPATDTIIESDDTNNVIENIPNRKFIFQGQTPQGFRLNTIAAAYELALKDPNFTTTDDCGVVKKYLPDIQICIVKGSQKNMKLTYIEDLYMIDKLYQLNSIITSKERDFSELNGKTIIVFGGNSGIGKEICDMAAEYKANVFSFSRSTTGTDISKIDDINAALSDVYDKTGRIDYVVVTAAVLMHEPLNSMSYEEIQNTININLLGAVLVSQCSYQYLKQSKGQLLHFTSSSYTLGRPMYSLYSSTKAAVVNFVQAISQEWQKDGIRVNCINPERTQTSMRIKNFGNEDESTLLKAKDVADISLAALLSDYSGQVVDVKLVDF